MPINMYLVKPGSSYEYGKDERKDAPRAGEEDVDEFCGFPHLPSTAQLATIDWGEFYGD